MSKKKATPAAAVPAVSILEKVSPLDGAIALSVVKDSAKVFAKKWPSPVSSIADFSFTRIPTFVAKGLRRCFVPGAGVSFAGQSTHDTCNSDFWLGKDGAVLVRVTWMGYSWSFRAHMGSGQPIPNEREPMENFSEFVMDELRRWMVEDAADLPPFEDYETQ